MTGPLLLVFDKVLYAVFDTMIVRSPVQVARCAR